MLIWVVVLLHYEWDLNNALGVTIAWVCPRWHNSNAAHSALLSNSTSFFWLQLWDKICLVVPQTWTADANEKGVHYIYITVSEGTKAFAPNPTETALAAGSLSFWSQEPTEFCDYGSLEFVRGISCGILRQTRVVINVDYLYSMFFLKFGCGFMLATKGLDNN